MTDAPPDEAWGFEWGTAEGAGGFVRLSLHRAERIAWFWAYLWRPGLGPVVVRDHEVMLPRGSALEIRADALWSELVCETADEHWSIGLEAFGVALDDPLDALAGEIGERIALGFDLEWETEGEPYRSSLRDVAFTDQPGRVRGEVLLGRERIPVDTPGGFQHSVGPVDRTERTRTTVAWTDGAWDAPDRVGAEIDVEVLAVVLIPTPDGTVERAIGAVGAGDRHGTAWIERFPDLRAKIT